MQSLSERTAGFTDSVIRRMTRVSMQYDAVNLSQGFPDFEPPKELLDRLAQVAYEDYHQYSIRSAAIILPSLSCISRARMRISARAIRICRTR